MTIYRVLLILGVLALAACQPPATPAPAPTAAPVPTSALVEPVATATGMAAKTTPVVGATPVIVARQEGTPVAMLAGVKLQPGHKYRLAVTSSIGSVAFTGTWSQSAVGAVGLPSIKSGLLEGTTPANLDIAPPVDSVVKDWLYSASASSKAGGSITLTILDVTP